MVDEKFERGKGYRGSCQSNKKNQPVRCNQSRTKNPGKNGLNKLCTVYDIDED